MGQTSFGGVGDARLSTSGRMAASARFVVVSKKYYVPSLLATVIGVVVWWYVEFSGFESFYANKLI